MRGLNLLVERLEPFELGREAAFRGRVDDEDDFVLESGEGVGLAFFCKTRGEGRRLLVWRGLCERGEAGVMRRTVQRLEIVESGR